MFGAQRSCDASASLSQEAVVHQPVARHGRRSTEPLFPQDTGQKGPSTAAAINQVKAMLAGWEVAVAGMNQQNASNSNKPYQEEMPGPRKSFMSTSADPNPYSSSSRTSVGTQGYITTYPAAPDHNSDAWLQAYQQQLQQGPDNSQQYQPVAHGYNSYSQGLKPSSPGGRPLEWNIRSSPPPDQTVDPNRQSTHSSIINSNQQALQNSGRQTYSSSNSQGYSSRNSMATLGAAAAAAAAGGGGSLRSASPGRARARAGSDPKPRPSTRVAITPSGYPLMQASTPEELGRSDNQRALAKSGSFGAPAAAGAAAFAAPGAGLHPAPLQWGVKASGPGGNTAAAAAAGGAQRGMKPRAQKEHEALWSGTEGLGGAGERSAVAPAAAREPVQAHSRRGYDKEAPGSGWESSANTSASHSSSSRYGSSSGGYSNQTRPPSQQMSEGLSRLKQLSNARLASRLTTPPDGKVNPQTYQPTAAAALTGSLTASQRAAAGSNNFSLRSSAADVTATPSQHLASLASTRSHNSSATAAAAAATAAVAAVSKGSKGHQKPTWSNEAEYSPTLVDEEEVVAMEPLFECSSCGRKFLEAALERHVKICDKVFGQKRKAFNTAAHRTQGTDAAAAAARPGRGASSGGKPPANKPGSNQKPPGLGGTGRLSQGGGNSSSRSTGGKPSALDDRPAVSAAMEKKTKWQKQSEQLRAAMRAQKQIADAQARGEDIRTLKIDMGPEPEDDRVPCPHCGRRFAALTAERHIPKCRDIIAKPKELKAGGGKSAFMRTPGATKRR